MRVNGGHLKAPRVGNAFRSGTTHKGSEGAVLIQRPGTIRKVKNKPTREIAMKETEVIDAENMIPVEEVLTTTIDTYQRLVVALQDISRHESSLIRAKEEVQSCRKRLAELKHTYTRYLTEEDYRGSDPTTLWDFPEKADGLLGR